MRLAGQYRPDVGARGWWTLWLPDTAQEVSGITVAPVSASAETLGEAWDELLRVMGRRVVLDPWSWTWTAEQVNDASFGVVDGS